MDVSADIWPDMMDIMEDFENGIQRSQWAGSNIGLYLPTGRQGSAGLEIYGNSGKGV